MIERVNITQTDDRIGPNCFAIWEAELDHWEYRLYATVDLDQFLMVVPNGELFAVKMGLSCLFFTGHDVQVVNPPHNAYIVLQALSPVVRQYIEEHSGKEKQEATFVARILSEGEWDLL